MILVNTDFISGKIRIVKGCTIQSKNIDRDIADPQSSENRISFQRTPPQNLSRMLLFLFG